MDSTNKKVIAAISGYVALLVVIAHLMGCNNYNNYNVTELRYKKSGRIATDTGAATAAVVQAGLRIESISSKRVTTKWEYSLIDEKLFNVKEIVIRYVIDVRRGVVKGQCVYRFVNTLKGPDTGWRFRICVDHRTLQSITATVERLQSHMNVTLSQLRKTVPLPGIRR